MKKCYNCYGSGDVDIDFGIIGALVTPFTGSPTKVCTVCRGTGQLNN